MAVLNADSALSRLSPSAEEALTSPAKTSRVAMASLVNTVEPLYPFNRIGIRASPEQADVFLDEAVHFRREPSLRKILPRGETQLTQTGDLDHRENAGDICFNFGSYEAHDFPKALADELSAGACSFLEWHFAMRCEPHLVNKGNGPRQRL